MSKFYDSQVSSCLTSECQWKSGDDGSFTKENQWQQMFKQQELQEICAQSSGGLKAKCKYCGLHIDDGASHYFKRFKVCKQCSAAPQLIIEGRPHRFCQKCSKFEVLSAFDNAKKTCRERLLRHNELRRNKYKSKNIKNATTTKIPMKPQFQLSFFPTYPNYDYNQVIQQCQEKAKQVESLTSQLRRNESFESQESCVTDAKKCDNMPVVDKRCSNQGRLTLLLLVDDHAKHCLLPIARLWASEAIAPVCSW
eukprot:TRINITY_DN5838_c1_g1_i2.p2 TRINITY_DN5838_c1_g1~~TRINITY_DN5838_c1_g1_i2.p2  ORF type:complete len:252 (+),score=5.98 TRINITY_DN5838_c1_g1_i2:692-1447(+)